VDDLNIRCEKKTDASLYRTNILVDGCAPYDEVRFFSVNKVSTIQMKRFL
jgi:uncharacterized protein YcbX